MSYKSLFVIYLLFEYILQYTDLYNLFYIVPTLIKGIFSILKMVKAGLILGLFGSSQKFSNDKVILFIHEPALPFII